MEIEARLKEINEELKTYLASLLSSDEILIDFIKEANDLSALFLHTIKNVEGFDMDYDTFFEDLKNKFPQMTIEENLNLVLDYFSKTYNGIYDEEIKKLIYDGTLFISFKNEEDNEFTTRVYENEIMELETYKKELEFELKNSRFDYENDMLRKNFINGRIAIIEKRISQLDFFLGSLYEATCIYEGRITSVNIASSGTIFDSLDLIHEIRHYLNVSGKKKGFIDGICSEGLSHFEELNYINYLEKIENGIDVNLLRKEVIRRVKNAFKSFNVESFLVAVYEDFGSVSIENYKKYTKKDDSSSFENIILNSKIKKELSTTKRYVFGFILTLYLNYTLRLNPEFINQIIELNSDVKKQPEVENIYDVIDFFKKIGFDISNIEEIKELINSELEYILGLGEIQEIKI